MKKTYWIGWNCPEDDFRPVNWPPSVRGYWCSGSGEGYWTMCAVVDADSKAAALAIVKLDWPEFTSPDRFCNQQDPGWWPLSDRFPVPDWSKS
jgi:hypothetical protein